MTFFTHNLYSLSCHLAISCALCIMKSFTLGIAKVKNSMHVVTFYSKRISLNSIPSFLVPTLTFLKQIGTPLTSNKNRDYIRVNLIRIKSLTCTRWLCTPMMHLRWLYVVEAWAYMSHLLMVFATTWVEIMWHVHKERLQLLKISMLTYFIQFMIVLHHHRPSLSQHSRVWGLISRC